MGRGFSGTRILVLEGRQVIRVGRYLGHRYLGRYGLGLRVEGRVLEFDEVGG